MIREIRTELRRTAARQHLVQGLIYETFARNHERDTPIALADVMLTPEIEAMLVDLYAATHSPGQARWTRRKAGPSLHP